MINQAEKDENFVNTLTGTLNTDGKTVVGVEANPSDHGLYVQDGTTGTDHGPLNAPRDGNDVPVLLAVSSADGVTVVPVYADSSGNLLIQST